MPLFIRPQSFFQTNPQVAADLYATARDWVRALGIDSMWDLFCGVGGFGLHCAQPQTRLTGIEISAEAIACARQSAQRLGLLHVDFQALDSTRFATAEGQVPQLVLVNPPRRGIGQALCDYLSLMAPDYILYSSCNAEVWRRYRDVAGVPHRTGAAVRHVPAYRALRGADAVGADFIKHKARITGPYCLLREPLVVDGLVGAVGLDGVQRGVQLGQQRLVIRAHRDAEAGAEVLRIGDVLAHRHQLRVGLQPLVHHGGIAEHAVDTAVFSSRMAFW